jgi:CheY-specific phosphatase CheX
MVRPLREVIVEAVTHILTLLTQDEVILPPPANEGPGSGPTARLRMAGALQGELFLCTAPSVALELGRLFSPDGAPLDQELAEDCVCELLNMVAESMRTLLNQQGDKTQVTAPELVDPSPSTWPAQQAFVGIPFAGGFLTFWFVESDAV